VPGLRQQLRLDAYNLIIIALIPSFMLIAAGATWFYERAEARRACSEATAYLEDATSFAGAYQSSGTLANARSWVAGMESLQPPTVARDLHDTAISAVTYASSTNPGADTSVPGGLYETLTPFQDSLDSGRNELVETCPDLASLIPDAFPMFFTKDGQ